MRSLIFSGLLLICASSYGFSEFVSPMGEKLYLVNAEKVVLMAEPGKIHFYERDAWGKDTLIFSTSWVNRFGRQAISIHWGDNHLGDVIDAVKLKIKNLSQEEKVIVLRPTGSALRSGWIQPFPEVGLMLKEALSGIQSKEIVQTAFSAKLKEFDSKMNKEAGK